jgi:hypothetical protein
MPWSGMGRWFRLLEQRDSATGGMLLALWELGG